MHEGKPNRWKSPNRSIWPVATESPREMNAQRALNLDNKVVIGYVFRVLWFELNGEDFPSKLQRRDGGREASNTCIAGRHRSTLDQPTNGLECLLGRPRSAVKFGYIIMQMN